MQRKMIVSTLSLCLVLALTLGAVEKLAKPQSKDAVKKMEKAEKARIAKDYDTALALYGEVNQLEPNYAPAYFIAANLQLEREAVDAALANFEKALAISPDFTLAVNAYLRALLILSQKAIDGRDMQKVGIYYDKILNIKNIEATHPQELQNMTYRMGSIEFSQKNFEKSIAAFLRFQAIPEIEKTAASKSALANYMIGINYSQLAQPEKAKPFLEKFISGPQDDVTTPWVPLGYYFLASNDYLVLEKQVAKIKEEKANDALATLDSIAAAAKASNAIQPNLVKAIELKPDLEDAYVKLGNYYFYCQDFDNASKTYTDLTVKFPASPDIASYKAFIEKIAKEREAIKTFKAKAGKAKTKTK
jgi:tetratricopeptide (TPR) repeat protein